MGMFDDLTCHYPLPGQHAAEAATFRFQTKDLDCVLAHYVIAQDGRLLLESAKGADEGSQTAEELAATSGGAGDTAPVLRELLDSDERQTPVPFSGSVRFYGSNIVSYHPHYTANGEDAIQVEYVALFQNGVVSSMTQTECEVSPAPAVKDKPPGRLPLPVLTDEEKATIEVRRNEPLTGKIIFVRYGGQDSPIREAAVVAEDEREVVARYKKPEYGQRHVIFYRSDRDHLFFDSPEEAQTHYENRLREFEEGRESERSHHAALLAERARRG